MTETAQKKIATMKKLSKTFKTVTMVLSLVAVVLVIFYLLAPATNLYLAGSDSKYGRDGGYNYYGWQIAIVGFGYPPVSILAMFENPALLAGDLVPTTYDFDWFNTELLVAIFLPIVTLIVCGIVAGKMKNRGKAVCEFVVAIVFIVSAIIFANTLSISIEAATNMGTTPFKNNFLYPAINNGTYTIAFYPVFLSVMLIVFAVAKAARGAFLLYQRSFVLKNK